MYGKGNCVQHPVINHNRKEIGKEYTHIYIYVQLNTLLSTRH